MGVYKPAVWVSVPETVVIVALAPLSVYAAWRHNKEKVITFNLSDTSMRYY